jgi:prepilin-type N-terminal cleavage/methylation domain-containing protein
MAVVRRSKVGFTLVELMIVVVIVGILSVLAITGYRKYIYASRNAEAVQFLGGVRAAQMAYYQANGAFCGVPGDGDRWPRDIPSLDTGKLRWNDPGDPIPAISAWHDLAVESPGSVWFQYRVAAGRAGQPGGGAIQNSQRPWFWAQANGDFDGNGVLSTFEVTSEKPDVWRKNENE